MKNRRPSIEEIQAYLKKNPHITNPRELLKVWDIPKSRARSFLKFLQKCWPGGEQTPTKRSKQRPGKRIVPAKPSRAEGRVGTYTPLKAGGVVSPCNRRVKEEWFISNPPEGLQQGDVVVITTTGATTKIIERLGHIDDPALTSFIALHEHQIPYTFPPTVLELAELGEVPNKRGRTELRNLPLVTIDGEDARDFDDAVFAEPHPDIPGGWHIIVAIADVSHYVQPGDALDVEAQKRGNSVYFPDRVVPMLPETLSNGLCSLQPDVDRACVAVHLWIDEAGHLRRYEFVRGLMRSAARLTYNQVETVLEGAKHPLQKEILNLYKAYKVLHQARVKRGALEIHSEEYKVVFSTPHQISAIVRRARLQSHQLIEEMMILANVAAAEFIEKHRVPCVYRVHETPDPAKITTLNEFMSRTLGSHLPKGSKPIKAEAPRQKDFNKLLHGFDHTPHRSVVNDMVLRCQSQARYSPHNQGHYGLNLQKYAHFTSPIRRYADLLVHRAILSILEHTKFPYSVHNLETIGEAISGTERRAIMAERDTTERYACQFLAPKTGATFMGRISGVTRFNLFVTLDEFGATGIVPIEALGPKQRFFYDAVKQSLSSRKQSYTLGDLILIQLSEVNIANGRVMFTLAEN